MRTLLRCGLLSVCLAGCGGDAASTDASNSPPDARARDATSPANDAFDPGLTDAVVADDATTDVPRTDVAAADAATDAGAPTARVYVGGGDGRIAVYRMDTRDGTLSFASRTAAGNYPSFLALAPESNRVYAVNESDDAVAAFAMDANTGALTFLDRVASGGSGPAYVALDRAGRHVLVANYGGGTAAAFALGADGSLGARTANPRPGVNPHAILTDPSDRYAFVPCKGSDWIAQYRYDATSGTLTPNRVATVATARGAGPRHLAFHPNGRFVYVINELNNTVAGYRFDASAGTLTPLAFSPVTTLPDGYRDPNTAADLHFAPSGRFLYGSNRGHDSIAVFAVDGTTGALTRLGHTRTEGRTPRNFAIAPSGDFLFAANQDSRTVVTFRIDPTTGALSRLRATDVGTGAYWVGVLAQQSRSQ